MNTVVAVDQFQFVSPRDYSGLAADIAPSSVAADGGVFYARLVVIKMVSCQGGYVVLLNIQKMVDLKSDSFP